MIRKLIATSALAALAAAGILGISARQSLADDSGTITASVSVQAAPVPCLTLTGTSISFGTDLQFEQVVFGLTGTALENCSTAPTDVLGSVSTFVGPIVTWTAADPTPGGGGGPVNQCAPGNALAGGNKFAMRSHALTLQPTLAWDGNLIPTPRLLTGAAGTVQPNTLISVNHELNMPCQGSNGAGSTLSATITYTAVLH